MKHINKFSESSKKDDILEYLKICFLDMFDEYGEFNPNNTGGHVEGMSIEYLHTTHDIYLVSTPAIWVSGVFFTKNHTEFEDSDALINYAEFSVKLSKAIQEGMSKFSIKYNYESNIYLSDYIEVKIWAVEEK